MHPKPLLHDVLRSQGLDQLTNKLQRASLRPMNARNDDYDSEDELVGVVSHLPTVLVFTHLPPTYVAIYPGYTSTVAAYKSCLITDTRVA